MTHEHCAAHGPMCRIHSYTSPVQSDPRTGGKVLAITVPRNYKLTGGK